MRPWALAALAVAVAAGPASPQDARPAAPAPHYGATVRARVTVPQLRQDRGSISETLRPTTWRGRLLALDADSLRIDGGEGRILAAPLADVSKIEMLAGRKPVGFLKGSGIGAGAGALGLGIVGASACEDDFFMSSGECTAMSFVAGALLGGVAGGLLGLLIKTDRWVEVRTGR